MSDDFDADALSTLAYYQSIGKYTSVVGFTLYLFDFLLTLDDEVIRLYASLLEAAPNDHADFLLLGRCKGRVACLGPVSCCRSIL